MLWALLAITAQGLIPIGFMPKTDKNGQTSIEICTAQGVSTVIIESDSETDKKARGKNHHKEKCPYAASLWHDKDNAVVLKRPFTKPAQSEVTYAHNISYIAFKSNLTRAPPYKI